LELAAGEFMRREENACFAGESGLGKTHLIQGVGRKCSALGYRVSYETIASLIEALTNARAVKALALKVRHFSPRDILTIDEFGSEKRERKEVPSAMGLLCIVIDGWNRRSSTAVTTNVNFDDWTEYLKRRIRLTEVTARIGWESTVGPGGQLRGPCPLPGCARAGSTPRNQQPL
jgi:DNA replication protein DnaC